MVEETSQQLTPPNSHYTECPQRQNPLHETVSQPELLIMTPRPTSDPPPPSDAESQHVGNFLACWCDRVWRAPLNCHISVERKLAAERRCSDKTSSLFVNLSSLTSRSGHREGATGDRGSRWDGYGDPRGVQGSRKSYCRVFWSVAGWCVFLPVIKPTSSFASGTGSSFISSSCSL